MTDVPKRSALTLRSRAVKLVESTSFTTAIICLIVLNAALLGIETLPSIGSRFLAVLTFLDRVILLLFVAELALKIFAYRLSFFKGGWNLFDVLIVVISLVPGSATSVLRTLRVLRVLRLISAVPSLRLVVQALLSALPPMASVVGLLSLIFFVFSVMATKLYGTSLPFEFGALHLSLLTLFQIMTMDSWTEIVRTLMAEGHASAPFFFVFFVIISGFAVLNLFIGILVEAIDRVRDQEKTHSLDTIAEQITKLQADLDNYQSQIDLKRGKLETQLDRAERGRTYIDLDD